MLMAPTQRAILLVAAGAPVALLLGVLLPKFWTIGLGWVVFIAILTVIDALLSLPGGAIDVTVKAPSVVAVGDNYRVYITARWVARARLIRPKVALEVSPIIETGRPLRAPLARGEAEIILFPNRRGTAKITALWLRWEGVFGLMAQQRRFTLDTETLVAPNIGAVRSDGVRLFQRDALHGLIAQLERGEGTDFDALVDFQAGMDKRSIDWRQSGRHTHLLAKQYRTERDNRIVFAIDCGRTMSEPLDGVPRVDRAISAALLTAWSALKLGDRASLFGFDTRPRLHSGELTGVENFSVLQKLAGTLDYSTEETNHVLALSTLSQQLKRRSLIILFTDFTDPTGADLLVRALGWLIKRHVVLFVVMRDADLTALMNAEPIDARDVTRSVAAAALVGEQRKVMARLRRLGLDVIEADHHQIGLQLVAAYIAIKQKGRL
ncbi:MAG: DUF58 domain-containing protein [Sphingomonadaceae bacterium]